MFHFLQGIEEEKQKLSNRMTNVQTSLNLIFGEAIRVSFPSLINPPIAVQQAQNERFGDYQCNSAMAIAQVNSFFPNKKV